MTSSPARGGTRPATPGGGIFLLLATTITLASVISTVMSVHLLTILQAKGLALAAAVSLGALVGPSQVTARTIEMLIARFHHPIWTKIAATSLVTAGLAALVDWRPDHHPCAPALWRGDRPGKHRAGNAAARDFRPGTLSRHHGPHRHAEPDRPGGSADDRRAAAQDGSGLTERWRCSSPPPRSMCCW